VWTDDAGKLDYDSALEGMVRDARVILSREVRHSILKITPGGEKEPATTDALFDEEETTVTVAFGLRNVTDKDKALADIFRVLKPGGRLLVLEFSKVQSELFGKLYDFHSFKVLPKLGQLFAGDAHSYQYLAESIRKHPDQQTLKGMMERAGYGRVEVRNLSGGIVAIHRAYKL
jgi:ubiquinone/menaquinone biosynthesis methyltransferase